MPAMITKPIVTVTACLMFTMVVGSSTDSPKSIVERLKTGTASFEGVVSIKFFHEILKEIQQQWDTSGGPMITALKSCGYKVSSQARKPKRKDKIPDAPELSMDDLLESKDRLASEVENLDAIIKRHALANYKTPYSIKFRKEKHDSAILRLDDLIKACKMPRLQPELKDLILGFAFGDPCTMTDVEDAKALHDLTKKTNIDNMKLEYIRNYMRRKLDLPLLPFDRYSRLRPAIRNRPATGLKSAVEEEMKDECRLDSRYPLREMHSYRKRSQQKDAKRSRSYERDISCLQRWAEEIGEQVEEIVLPLPTGDETVKPVSSKSKCNHRRFGCLPCDLVEAQRKHRESANSADLEDTIKELVQNENVKCTDCSVWRRRKDLRGPSQEAMCITCYYE